MIYLNTNIERLKFQAKTSGLIMLGNSTVLYIICLIQISKKLYHSIILHH